MRRHNTTHKRRQAFRLHDLNRRQQQEYLTMVSQFALYISRKLEREGKIKPVETCDGSFDTYYTNDDASKITHELFKTVTSSQKAARFAHRELRQVKRDVPGRNFSLKLLLVLLLSSMAQTTDAKWNEWSSPPTEISKYDSIAAGLVGSGMVLVGEALWFPPLGVLGAGMVGCGLVTRGVGSAHRLIDHVRGVHPLTGADATTEALGVLVPGSSAVWRGAFADTDRMVGWASGYGPQLTFTREGPGLGENIRPAIESAIGPYLDKAVESGKLPAQERNAIIESASSAAQGAIEYGVEAVPGIGYAGIVGYKELQTKLSEK